MATQQQIQQALGSAPAQKKNNPVVNKLKKEMEGLVSGKKKLLDKVRESKAIAGRVGFRALAKTEYAGTAFLASLLDGKLGPRPDGKRRLQIAGKVDLRGALAIPLEIADIWLTAVGHEAGQHVGAVADGLAAPVLVRWGIEAGEAWRRGAPAPAPAPPGTSGEDDPDLQGLRQIAMTDSTLGTGAETAEHNRFRQVHTT